MMDLVSEAILDHMKEVMNRRVLVKRWRALKLPGRLYWRNTTYWRDWDSRAFACYKEGTARTWYYTMHALKMDLVEMEMQQAAQQPPAKETP